MMVRGLLSRLERDEGALALERLPDAGGRPPGWVPVCPNLRGGEEAQAAHWSAAVLRRRGWRWARRAGAARAGEGRACTSFAVPSRTARINSPKVILGVPRQEGGRSSVASATRHVRRGMQRSGAAQPRFCSSATSVSRKQVDAASGVRPNHRSGSKGRWQEIDIAS